jgi:hypothetical protein
VDITINMDNAGELTFEEFLLLNRAPDGNLSTAEQIKAMGGLTKLVNEDLSQVKLKDIGPIFEAVMEAFAEVSNPETSEGN